MRGNVTRNWIAAILLAIFATPGAVAMTSSGDAAVQSTRADADVASDVPPTTGFHRTSQQRKLVRRSHAHTAGLSRGENWLDLRSSVVLVVDQDTDEVLYEKNGRAVLPIASITKLMTAIVTIEADLDPDELLQVTRSDVTIDKVRSRLRPGVSLKRSHALQLALMSSENHAAQLLGRTYPGGVDAFVEAMNAMAQMLGMHESRFVDPTGLSDENRSSPADLVRLVKAAYEHSLIREYSTSDSLALPVGRRLVRYGNTNRLTSSPEWEIGLQKTGYISASGRCLVMQSVIEGQRVVMVLLDSVGKHSRIGDAKRIRNWIEARRARLGETARSSNSLM